MNKAWKPAPVPVHTRKKTETSETPSAYVVITQSAALCQETEIVPNVVAEWLTLLLRIREVLGFNLGPETGYLD
jgi:hypothetical protein